MSITKCWSIAIVAVNKVAITDSHHFFQEIELQQECFSVRVIQISVSDFVPLVFGERADSLAEFCLHDGECVLHIIAILMKLGSLKIMLRCSEQQSQRFGLLQRAIEESQL
jgi:hypothetical protein